MHPVSLLRVPRRVNAVEYFIRILQRSGGGIKLGDLITTEVLKFGASSPNAETLSELVDQLSEDRRSELLTREVLLAAAGSGSDSCLAFLLEQNDFRQYSQYYEDVLNFYKAAWSISTGKQRELLRRGVYVNAPYMSQGRTMLSFSAGFNELASVRVFMNYPGFDLEAVDYDGRTALHWACIRGHETVVELLLERGASAAVKDSRSLTPEHYARQNSHFLVAELVRGYTAAKGPSGEFAER
jgi:ankyrin repeat protein